MLGPKLRLALGLAFVVLAILAGVTLAGFAASRAPTEAEPAEDRSPADEPLHSADSAGAPAPADNPPTLRPGAAAAPDLVAHAAFIRPSEPDQDYNTPYDGRFTFARVRFDVGFGGGRRGFGREPPWAHDYPRAERHLMQILSETTTLEPYMDGGNIFALDDPDLFRYPLAYVSEPGYWRPTEDEVQGLRDYILKGGFVIFDDFRGGDWYNFETQMRRVLPEALLEPMDIAHPIFHSFFDIASLDIAPPTFQQYRPVYYGVFLLERDGRELVAIANYNNDIGEYWEWSDTGFVPIDLSNEAYKLGVNYIVYAMTH